MYDAIVVGARVAGSATARLLAAGGQKVLLVDKSTFPSDTMSTLFLQPGAVARLDRWGLLPQLVASGCPAMPEITISIDDIAFTGLAWSPDTVTALYSPRRTVLDKILVDAAVAAGVELREAFVFEDVVRDGDRVVGIRGHAKGGESVVERARIVIGADGMRSAVARAVGAEMFVEVPPAACWYYTFYSGMSASRDGAMFSEGRSIGSWRTHDGLAIVIAGWPIAKWHEVKADLEGSFDAILDIDPELAARVRAGRREERFVGSGELAGFYRRSHGSGWALVGDAGYHKDPCTAQGISDAFTYGELLAQKLLAGEDLATYQRERDERTRPVFEHTCRTARLEPVAERTKQFLRVVKTSPVETRQFLGTIAGTVHASRFFAPDNIARIMRG
jgi:flavin-dependent dehydrogenase